jgi:hypothetical protein
MIRHVSKTPRIIKEKRTAYITSEKNETLKWFVAAFPDHLSWLCSCTGSVLFNNLFINC